MRAELVAKDMVHQVRGPGGHHQKYLAALHRERLPAHLRDEFVREIAGRYLERYPLDEKGQAHVQSCAWKWKQKSHALIWPHAANKPQRHDLVVVNRIQISVLS